MNRQKDLACAVVDILSGGPRDRGDLIRLSGASEAELDRVLARLERAGAVYRVRGVWHLSTRLIVRREFMRALSQGRLPEPLHTFLRELWSAGRLGVDFENSLEMARRKVGGWEFIFESGELGCRQTGPARTPRIFPCVCAGGPGEARVKKNRVGRYQTAGVRAI